MEAPAPVRRSVPRALRRAWLVGAVLLAVGVVLPGSLLAAPGVLPDQADDFAWVSLDHISRVEPLETQRPADQSEGRPERQA